MNQMLYSSKLGRQNRGIPGFRNRRYPRKVDLMQGYTFSRGFRKEDTMMAKISIIIVLIQLANAGTSQSQPKKEDTLHKEFPNTYKEYSGEMERQVAEVMSALKHIYHKDIKPIEDLYEYHDFQGNYHLTDGDIDANPMVLTLGPWSSGKSTLINYILELDENGPHQPTGSEPTTSEFTILMHGNIPRKVDGTALVTDDRKPYTFLANFGTGFLERLLGYELPSDILKKVTFVDTPGIIENRRQQERGYPFNDVMHWFIDRADLILVVFDPTKLDVGTELESIFYRLKGHESKIKIIMNKADVLDTGELMRVYGALFWNLSPLINVTEPPRVYVGSFWSKQFKDDEFKNLFLHEEYLLGVDLHMIVLNHVQSKISTIRQRAISARIHALTVHAYKQRFNQHSSSVYNNERKKQEIFANPAKYSVFQLVLSNANVSRFDLPSSQSMSNFFRIHPLDSFQLLNSNMVSNLFYSCPLKLIETAIFGKLPDLLKLLNDNDLQQISEKQQTSEKQKTEL
ncbi:sarcalumenin-like [Anneissia japonica]|uniref:sarcalumenin-like n=1 Tax=Anneissia japonica TaxID=1529436 RepID=UPI00142594BA|nr:sarcalumenin-like [Anneissia japonica]